MTNADTKTISERRRIDKERMLAIKHEDISAALAAVTEMPDIYSEWSRNYAAWREGVRQMSLTLNNTIERMKMRDGQLKEAFELFSKFNRNAEKLLGASTRAYLVECRVPSIDITEVADDSRFNAMLAKIAAAQPPEALKMTKAAYAIAVDTIGAFKSKLIKMDKVESTAGSSDGEVSVARRKIVRMQQTVDILKHRKDVLVELNLVYYRKLKTFADENIINPKKDRDLTDAEVAALKGISK